MSRIGQSIIKIPDGIEVKHEGNNFWAKGLKGELTAPVSSNVIVTIKDNTISVELKNNDAMRMQSVLWVTVEMIRRISIMLQPVMPESCKRLLDLLCIEDDKRVLSFIGDEFSLTPGEVIKEPVIIFPKIEYKN